MLEQFLAWCYSTPILAVLRDTRFGMPISQSFHLLGITVLLGSTVVFNLRLTGVGFREVSLKTLADNLWPWARSAVAVTMFTGLLIFIVDPKRYVVNGPFRLKMLLLLCALAFQFTVFKRTVISGDGDRLPASRRWLIASVSVLLWFGVGWSGRFIGFL
jgi:hypothetical protein